MRKKLFVVALAVVAALLLPLGIAAADTKPAAFSANANIMQASPGSMLPIIVNGKQVGVSATGEVFVGLFDGCSGKRCELITGASISVTQNAKILFLPADPATGVLKFAGSVNGTFTITAPPGSSGTLSGSYTGFVTGTLTPTGMPIPGQPGQYFMTIDGQHHSAWKTTGTSGIFAPYGKSFGTINAPIGGLFPGGEIISAKINGVLR